MRAFRRVLVFLVLAWLLIFEGAWSQGETIYTDADGYLWVRGICFLGNFFPRWERFRFVSASDPHPVGYKWEYSWWPGWLGEGGFVRSYIHFPKDGLPSCVGKAYLRLYFHQPVPSPLTVKLYAVEWDGNAISWFTAPPEDYITSFQVAAEGWVEVNVTSVVKDVLEGDREELAFMLALADDMCPGESRSAWAGFKDPELWIAPCIEVKVEGLEDFTLTQEWLSGHRYAPMGKLTVKVAASVPYEVRACYDVDPEPSPSFSADPVELAHTWVWMTLPRCPGYITLFSGMPGDETHSYRVRVDLADLGDRASGEEFTFTIRVWAVPQ